jgi:hypothetical protein
MATRAGGLLLKMRAAGMWVIPAAACDRDNDRGIEQYPGK